MQDTLQGGDGDLRHGAGGENTVKAHGMEPGLHIGKLLLSNDDVAAHQQRDAFQACFVAFFPHPPAVQLALPVKGGDDDGVRFGFNGRCDVLFLGDHHPQVDHVKSGFRESLVQNAVPHRVNVCTNDAHNQNFFLALHR